MEKSNSPSEINSVVIDQSIEDDDEGSRSSFSSINDDHCKDCRSNWVSWPLNIACSALYGYAIFYQNMDSQGTLYNRAMDPRLQPFGLLKYLTYNSLLMQFLSSILHLLASIVPKYRRVRDYIFTSLAYPIGNFVVVTFWTVWWTQGRDQIYPVAIEAYYPVWLNHLTHSMVLPINLTQAYLTFHQYKRGGFITTLLYMTIYSLFVLFIRFKAGIFVYPYLNQMSKIPFFIYLVSVLFSLLASYEFGSFVTSVFHNRRIRSHLD